MDYIEKFKESTKGRCFIFIDAANLELSVKDMYVNLKDISDEFKKYQSEDLCWRIDYKKLKLFFQKVCDLKNIRFYSADFKTESHFNFLWFLSKGLKFILQTKQVKEYSVCDDRKANFDVEIAVDAVNMINDYDTFILFSGDSDFEYLIKFLRGKEKRTIVFSKSGHVAKELPVAANRYFDIVDFRHEILRMDLKNKQAKNPAEAGPCS